MARPSNTLERRRQIIAGLANVMADVGYERATIVAIARSAGLAPGLVHYHFGSKDDVLHALLARVVDVARARYQRRLEAAGTDAWGRLDAAIDALVALDDDADVRAAACWIQIGVEAPRNPVIAAAYREAVIHQHAVLTTHVAEIRAVQNRSPEDASEVAAGIMSAIEGAFRLASSAPEVVPWGQTARLVRKMARGLLESAR